jgi:membrane protein required for colicin V production
LDWLDLAIVGVLTWNTVSAFRRGLIREVVATVALIAGVILAGRYYDELSENLAFAIDDQTTRNLVAFASIFLGIALVGAVASTFLRSAAAVLMLGPIDHVGGAGFGLLRGILFVEVILIAVTMFPAWTGPAVAAADSTLAPYFLRAAPFIAGLLPEAFNETIDTLKAIAVPVAP